MTPPPPELEAILPKLKLRILLQIVNPVPAFKKFSDYPSLKADREDWGGGSLKTPAKHMENERHRDPSHRGSGGTKGTNEIP